MKIFSIALFAAALALAGCSSGGLGGGSEGEEVNLKVAQNVDVGPSDAKSVNIVSAAQAFLDSLTEVQRKAATYDFADNSQRARWSNFPTSFVERGGIMRKDLSATQLSALDVLLSEVLSAEGVRNAKLQMAADDSLVGGSGPIADFGSKFYYIAFLGTPSTKTPWMTQFGGHHLALNITLVGAKASFSPMLTGGQPLTVEFEGKKVYITREEVAAGQKLLASLNASQRAKAIRGSESINILLGPGEYGTKLAVEGVSGADLSAEQKELLFSVIAARVGQFNVRDAAIKMAEIRSTINETYFGWWGPENKFGAAYFRITGPKIVMEYGPQEMAGGDPAEHAHNMYRDPGNDYGAAWIEAK